jgi:hypothetical protein
MLNHKAYIDLPPTSKAMLPYFLGKVKIPSTDPSYYHATFSFTFSEATKYGCARRSFYRVIVTLMGHGFIDPVRKGRRIGGSDNASVFRLSKRWEKFKTPVFEKVSWPGFGADQIKTQVQKCLRPVATCAPGARTDAESGCQ